MPRPQLTFITKEGGCSLCDDAYEEIEAAQDYADFDLTIEKIEYGDRLWDLYWDKIPVILIDGKVAFTHRTSRDALLRALRPRPWWRKIF